MNGIDETLEWISDAELTGEDLWCWDDSEMFEVEECPEQC